MKKIKQHMVKILAVWMFLAIILSNGTGMNVPAAQIAETEQSQEDGKLNYTILGSANLTAPGTQTVVASLGQEGENSITSAVLTYRNSRTGAAYSVNAENIYEDTVLFSMAYPDESWKGVYELTEISYVSDDTKTSLAFEKLGMDVRFGVNEEINSDPDERLTEEEDAQSLEEISMDIISVDDSGNVSETDFEQAIRSASAGSRAVSEEIDRTGASSLVVVLDPGHGGNDSGAAANGLLEKNLNLKIAQYCKAELETYSGIKIYMTRNDDTYVTLDGRTAYASSVKADVFVSIHINSATNSAAQGAEVYYPNGSYRPDLGEKGRGLSSEILKKLVALGLSDRGIKIQNSRSGDTYADGSLADYYAVIRGAKKAGFPGIIVEHAFISNSSDARNYLGSDAALKKLGIADAQGIASYYKLKKKNGSETDKVAKTSITQLVGKNSTYAYLKWKKINDADGYEIYRSTAQDGTYEKIKNITKGSTVSYQDKSVKSGKTYYYKVRAYRKNSGDKITGSFSKIQKVSILKKPVISSIKSASGAKIKLSWQKVKSASKYEIYRSTSKNGTYKRVATVKKSSTSYTDKKLTAKKKYYYKIRVVGAGVNGSSYSSYSLVKFKRTK